MFLKYLTIFLACCLLMGCTQQRNSKHFKIGFSQSGEADEWRETMLAEMRQELYFHPGMEMLYKVTHDNTQVQIRQVRELLQQKIDILIISATEADALTPIVEEVYRAGIPVIIIDRKISSENFTNHISADNTEIGRLAADYLANKLGQKGQLLEITGRPSSSPALERATGFKDELKKYPNMRIQSVIDGDWLQHTSEKELKTQLASMGRIDGIFSHNDVMALGAFEALQNTHHPIVPIIGVDALPSPNIGLNLIGQKKISASILYPTGGKEAIQNAAAILQGQKIAKQTTLQTLVVDNSNVASMQLQYDKILSQYKDIERQQQLLDRQLKIYRNQRMYIYILVATLTLVLLFAGLLYYSRKKNKAINHKLEQKNQAIEIQSLQIKEISEKAIMANEERLNFFTKISHEFRTPLTLIIAPIDILLENQRISAPVKKQLSLIRRNSYRLLQLVTQLMDFRKIEFQKLRPKYVQSNIVSFANEVLLAFETIAHKRNIDARILTSERDITVDFDPEMMDKILFNLLSNAFKFTHDNGSIYIKIDRIDNGQKVKIEITDDGIGMNQEDADNAFNAFYQGGAKQSKGTGLGLALTKELVMSQNGTISVKSAKDTGSTFTLILPMVQNRISPAADPTGIKEQMAEDALIYTSDLQPEEKSMDAEIDTIGHSLTHIPTLLIVDDSKEIRDVLREQLSQHYEILEAENGKTGLAKVFEYLPDMIICDVLMPEMDGMALTEKVKNDIRTAHIPIILLTAKASEETQLQGLKNKADAYLPKPFHFKLLSYTIENLLKNRKDLSNHFSTFTNSQNVPNTGVELHTSATNKKEDRLFVAHFKGIIEENLSNEQFNLSMIANQMQISKMQLHRKVKQLLQTSVNEYIVNLKIQKAKYLLQHSMEVNITEIAYKVGFSSAAYFSTAFKSKTGETPKQFRERFNPTHS